jgi:hypothetical protein
MTLKLASAFEPSSVAFLVMLMTSVSSGCSSAQPFEGITRSELLGTSPLSAKAVFAVSGPEAARLFLLFRRARDADNRRRCDKRHREPRADTPHDDSSERLRPAISRLVGR